MNRKYIIITDDDKEDREIFTDALPDFPGLRVDACTNGSELLEKLQLSDHLPDMVFLDLNMPVVGGKECLEVIRKNEHFKTMPVIIYSTSFSNKDIEETYHLGANLYVKKPNGFSELKQLLNTVIQVDWASLYPTDRNKFEYQPFHKYG